MGRNAIVLAVALAGCSSTGSDPSPKPERDVDVTARRLAAQQDAVLANPDKHWFDLPPDAASGLAAMADCDRYMTMIDAYVQCDKFPSTSRDSMAAMVKQMRDQWASIHDPDLQRTTNEACKSGMDAIRQAALQMGCAVPP